MSQDFSKYECPYSHIEKVCGHELRGPEGWQDTYGVWCECGFRGPVLVSDPEELKLKAKSQKQTKTKIPAQVRTVRNAVTGEVKHKDLAEDYDERCLYIYMNTHISQRDHLNIGDRVMFDHGAKVYCDRRG